MPSFKPVGAFNIVTYLFCFLLTFFHLITHAQQSYLGKQVSIPKNVVKTPPEDLLGPNATILSVGEAAGMAQRFLETKAGTDISILNPIQSLDTSGFNPLANKMWQDKKYPAEALDPKLKYPEGEVGVRILSFETQNNYHQIARVQSVADSSQYFRLGISRFTRNALMRAALMRKLGYYMFSPKHYSRIRLYFSSEAQKEDFLESSQRELAYDFQQFNFLLENNKENHSIVIADAILGSTDVTYFDLYWGQGPDPDDKDAGLKIYNRMSTYRSYRAVLAAAVLVEVPESINIFYPKIGDYRNGTVLMVHPSANSFAAASWEDMQWITRRIAKLSESDIREIVKLGSWHPELEELIYAKLVHRIKNLCDLFQLKSNFTLELPNLLINSATGIVQKGKVTQEIVNGIPFRVSHGDRESPFKDGDIEKLAGLKIKNSVLSSVLSFANSKLDFKNVEDLAKEHSQDLINDFVSQLKKNPFKMPTKEFQVWGGPLFNLNVVANRHLSTGTYNNSTAPVQLVDNVSISGSIGLFKALDGLKSAANVFGLANVTALRDYTHVRPVSSLDEAQKVPWKEIYVPKIMKSVAEVLKSDKLDKKSPEEKDVYSIDKFLRDLKEGEVFTVTNSVSLGTYGQVSSSLENILGIASQNFLNSMVISADKSKIITRQISIIKSSDDKGGNLQVLVRGNKRPAGGGTPADKLSVGGINFDINYFVNLFRWRVQAQEADFTTDVFVLDYDPYIADHLKFDDEKPSTPGLARQIKDYNYFRQKLAPALRAVLQDNDPQLLYQNFAHKQFSVDHLIKTKETKGKFLWFRSHNFEESHNLGIEMAKPREGEGSDMNSTAQKIQLYTYRRGEMQGKDLLGFGMDSLQAYMNHKLDLTSGKIDLAIESDPNPANLPFGESYWRTVTAEGDVTPSGAKYPDMAVISHNWGGWKVSGKKFLQIIDQLSTQFENTPVSGQNLIDRNLFLNVKSVDFFRISSIFTVLQSGIPKVQDLVTQTQSIDKNAPPAKFLSGLFQRLSNKGHSGSAANEAELLNQLMKILGDGDLEVGKSKYESICQNYYRLNQGEAYSGYTGAWKNGNYYECLTPWAQRLMDLSSKFPVDRRAQIKWMSEVLYILDEHIPLPQLLKYMEPKNYIFLVTIQGFRTGAEDALDPVFSNSLGEPQKKDNIKYSNGLVNYLSNMTRIVPFELDRTLIGVR